MRLFVSIVLLSVVSSSWAQGQVDPAYLRQYYSALQQQGGQPRQAAPIYEQQEPAPRFTQPAQAYQHRPQQNTQAFAPQQVRQYQPQPQIQYSQPAAPAPQPIQYKPQPAAPKRPAYKLQNQQLAEEEQEDYESNPSYQFGFDVKDDEFTNYQNRKEQREGNVIKGSYSVVDSDGFIRTVTYTADPKEGFKAEVVREPTNIVIKTPPITPAPETQQSQYRAQKAAQPQYIQPSQQGYRQAQQPRQEYQQQQQYQQ